MAFAKFNPCQPCCAEPSVPCLCLPTSPKHITIDTFKSVIFPFQYTIRFYTALFLNSLTQKWEGRARSWLTPSGPPDYFDVAIWCDNDTAGRPAISISGSLVDGTIIGHIGETANENHSTLCCPEELHSVYGPFNINKTRQNTDSIGSVFNYCSCSY